MSTKYRAVKNRMMDAGQTAYTLQLHHARGFTLIEIAIVLVIVGLLLGGLLMPLAAQVDTRRVAETDAALEEIRDAIYGFAIANGRMPCPADPSVASSTAGAGDERTPPCNGASARGVVPWQTLGISETDAWGRRYTYRVTQTFADASPSSALGCATVGSAASFALCSTGNITVTNGAASIASNIPAIVVSHGKNGLGAWLSDGTQLAGPSSTDEIENTDNDATFVSRTHSAAGSTSGEFDDLVAWVVPGILFNRMVAAKKLP